MKKILIIVFLIMLVITLYEIGDVYSYYKNQLVGEYKSGLGNWIIKINNNDLNKTKEPTQFELTNEYFKFVNSNLSVDDKIAPGKSMYADIVVDPTDTDVSIKYEIGINLPQDSCLMVEKVESKIEKKDGTSILENPISKNATGNYVGIIPVSKIQEGYINKVRIHITWKNYDAQDARDTEMGQQENLKLSIPMTLKFEQYKGENLKTPEGENVINGENGKNNKQNI